MLETEGGGPARGYAIQVIAELDTAVLRAVRTRGATPAGVRAATALSHLGEHALGWLALGTAGALTAPDADRRRAWQRATASVLLAHAGNVAVKRVARRPRPVLADLPALVRTPSRLSFPSAHAASTTAAAVAFAPLAPRVPWPAVAGAMCLSRVVLGVHYPTDVLAGAALGATVGRVVGHSRPPLV